MTPHTARRGRAAPMSADDRRKAIVDAAVPLIVEHGERVTTRLIAEAAGVAEGTIFRVFPDKNALLLAAAEETLNPAGGREALVASVAGMGDLREVVRAVAAQMFVRSERVMTVLMALRGVWATEQAERERQGEHRPPEFIAKSHQALLERLTAVFEPFRDELTVPPERAALLLRTLVLGSRHPGMGEEDYLTADEIADVLLHGIRRREES